MYKKELAKHHCTRPRNGPLMKTFNFNDADSGKKKAGNALSQGKYFGIKIDKQIEVSVALSVKHNLPCRFFYDKAVRLQYRDKLPAKIILAVHRMHIFTKRFWKAVDGLKWKPVASQVGVGCKKWNVATRIDVLALDEDEKEHVIEFKVGYDGYYYKCTSTKMKFPFEDKEDCMYHQHLVQVAITNELFKRTYRKGAAKSKKVGDPVVIRITPTNTYLYFLTDWVKSGVDKLKDVKAPLASM
jgi:hypothetical protein